MKSYDKTLWKRSAKKTKTKRGTPKSSEGFNGEITIRSTRRGLILFAKYANKWYEFGSASPVSDSVKNPVFKGMPEVSKTHKTLRLTSKHLDRLGEIGYDEKNSKIYVLAKDVFTGSTSLKNNLSEVVRDNSNTAVNLSYTPNNAVNTITLDTLMFTPGGNTTISVMDRSATGTTAGDAANLKILGGKAGTGAGNSGSHIFICPGDNGTHGSSTEGNVVLCHDGSSKIGHIHIPSDRKLFFDGGTHTYIQESTDDQLDFYVGNIRMLALSEVNNTTDFRSDDIRVTNELGGAYTANGSTSLQTKSQIDAAINIQVTKTTISEAEMDALHTTEKVLVAAQGSDKVIIPLKVVFLADRHVSTTQSNTPNMYVGMDGATAPGAGLWGYLKRFMWNETGDRIIQMHQGISDEVAQAGNFGDNKPLTAKLNSAITSGSIVACKVVVPYYVYDNS